MTKRKIETALRKALLQSGKMEYSLYEHELAENINYWYKELLRDREDYVFVGNYSGYKQPSSPSPFSQKGRRGNEPFQGPSPSLGEGFRVRAD